MNRISTLFAILAISVLAGCTNVHNITPYEDSEYITLSLGVSGTGDTKGTSSDNIYGIQVRYDSQKDGNIDAPYAYGLFDNTDNMTILLLKGYHYQFICTMVKNGKNVLYYGQYGSNTFSGYAKPFQRANSESTTLGNRFIYKSEDSDYLSGLDFGTATLKTTTGYEETTMPSIERYYGQYNDYTPNSGDVITIPLKKTVFGLRLIIEKAPQSGVLQGSCGPLSGHSTPSSIYDSGARLLSFYNVAECWAADNYSLDFQVQWDYTTPDVTLADQTGSRLISVKRNVLTTVTVSCSSIPSGIVAGSIGIITESLNEQNDIYLFVNSDGVIEIGIQPVPED